MPNGQRLRVRRVLVVADQAASSLSNVLVAILVARSFPGETEPFAAFSLAVMVFQFTIGSVRGLVFEPELLLHGDRTDDQARAVIPSYLGATVVVGTVVAVGIALAGMLVGGMAGSALVALSLVLPLVLVQDAWRYVFMVHRPGAALVIDLMWVVSSCTAVVLAPDDVAVGWFVLAWGAGGILGAVVATVLGRPKLRVPAPLAYLRRHRDLGLRFLGEFGTAQIGTYVALLSCGWILGLTAYGAVRGAYLFVGPIQMLMAGVIMSGVPEARRMRDDPVHVLRLVRGGIALVAAASVLWVAIGLALPAAAGEALMGATWADARSVLVWLGITMIGMAVIAGALVGVRAFDGTKGLRARVQAIPFQLACPIAGAYIGGLVGFSIGLAVGQAVSAAIWWATFRVLLLDAKRATARHLARGGLARGGRAGNRSVDILEALTASEDLV